MVPFQVSSNEGANWQGEANFTFHPTPILLSLTPAYGPTKGGSLVRIFGQNFERSGLSRCKFAEETVPARLVSPTQLQCYAPPAAEQGKISVQVSMNGVHYLERSLEYSYATSAGVVSLSPQSGGVEGGTVVTVSGTNFDGGQVHCRFGTSSPVQATAVSANSATCVSPVQQEPTAVSVDVSTNGLDYSSSGVQFSYRLSLRVLSISPSAGPETGSTQVTVVGANFVDSKSLLCRFGATASVPARWESSSKIVCATPSHMPGSVSVEVTNNDADFVGGGLKFTYMSQIVLASMKPESGSLRGGTSVSIYGSEFYFSGVLACRFGVVTVPASYVSKTETRCVSPAHAEGSITVEVSNNGVDFSSSGLEFQYKSAPVVQSVSPRSGPVTGGTLVTITGTHFDTAGMSCRFDSVTVAAKVY
jgi:hypothetical protein